MLRVARCTLVAASITLVLIGCQDAAAPSHGSPALGVTPTMSVQAYAPFVLHQVPPASTDDNIDKWLSDDFVWLYPGAERGEKLFVHLPGGNNPIQVPASFTFVGREAARLGYHVIVLTYPNDLAIEALCRGNPACQKAARLDIIDGGDRRSSIPELVQAGFDISKANSIDNRLTKLLDSLDAWHPEEGWSQFLNNGEPNWSQIVISGLSFGGSEAAMLAKLHRVNRVTLFAAPRDANTAGQPPDWVALGATPADRYYGLVHKRDPLSALTLASWRGPLEMLGEAVFDTASAPPYGGTHMLVTNRRTRVGTDLNPYLNAHGSVATDQFTPLDAPTLDYPDGKPQLLDAWRYMLDQEPPALTVPADFAVNATSPNGAVVSYVVSASDNVAVASLACSPTSGSVFAIGTIGVTCIATDPSGNQARATFREVRGHGK